MRPGKLIYPFVLAAFTVLWGCARQVPVRRVAVAFYNCENFFDTIHNPAKDDEDFTPGGWYHYTQKIYEQKLHNIATVIASIGGDDGLAITGLAEVENSRVLNDLVRQPEIAGKNYQYIWYDGPDERGINVALLYNPKYFQVLGSEPLHVDLSRIAVIDSGGKTSTRDVLHVYGILAGDTIHLFINHWPSRTGGDSATRSKRVIAANVDKDAIGKLIQQNPATKIIVMGDFNDNPTDSSIAGILGARADSSETEITGLYNPFFEIFKDGAGTEVYGHSWNLFDQVMVSGALLHNSNHQLHYDSAGIYKPDFLVDHYKGREGEPYRSWLGNYWLNGYSDHFPVILYLGKDH